MYTKKALRQQYKTLRQQIDAKEKYKLDDLMLLHLQQYTLETVSTLFTYWPMQKFNEPNTHLFTNYFRHFVPQLTLAYPVTCMKSFTMQAIEITNHTVYKTNEYLITEPTCGNVLDPKHIDVVFVPLLVCDANGYRVGYGKGIYDKYLAQVREDCIKIGFSYFEPVAEIADVNEWDIPLHICITPNNVYEF